MATFPALKPATRRYSMGVYPVTEERGFGGGSARFNHGTIPYGHTLELGFIALTAAQAKLLRDHYRTQQGGYVSFALSTEAWAGHDSATDLVPTTTSWRYAAPIEETHRTGGYVDVSVSLLSVTALVPSSIPGLLKIITATLTSGLPSIS